MESNNGRLISFRTRNNYEIIGMLFSQPQNKNDIIVIHIHGNFGNFYQNKFLWVMSNKYIENNIDFLTINLSSHDGLAEGYFGKDLKYVGGAVSSYNSSQDDIEAAIEFAKAKEYKIIILQGHSLGCDKIIQFTIEKSTSYPMILLSPVDSFKVQSEWISPETIENQIRRLKQDIKENNMDWGMAEFDWLPPHEYGAAGDTAEWTYQIPITREALVSILTGSAFNYLNMEFGTSFCLGNPTFAFIGMRDGLQMHDHTEWTLFLHKSFTSINIANDLDADHDIIGVEDILVERIIKWIRELYL